MLAQLDEAAVTLRGRTCVSCEERVGYPMLVKQQWEGDRYVIPVCDAALCRSYARMNWNGEIWRAGESESRVTITADLDTTGAKQSAEVTNELFQMLGYND